MGAYWHISLPVEVKFSDKKETSEIFEKTYGEDFVFDKVHDYQVESPKLPDGSRLTFDRSEKIYHLDVNLLKNEFKNFYIDFIKYFQEYTTNCKYNVYSMALDDDLIIPFMKKFNAIAFDDNLDSYMEILKGIKENYFINYFDLPGMIVYHGYPFPKSHNSSMQIISLLHSHEKMQLIPEETVTFHNVVDYVREKLKDKYIISKYVFVAGF